MTPSTFTLFNLVLFAAVSSALPHLTRPELFFAVTVTREFRRSATAARIVRQYNIFGWSGTLLTMILLLTGVVSHWTALVPAYLAWVAAYLLARKRVQPYRTAPTSVRQTVLSLNRERMPGGVLGALGPFLILAIKGVYAQLHWNEIPNRFPVHWGFNGPDRWVDRTPMAVFGSIAAVAAICALMLLIAYGTIYASRKVSVTGPAAESERKFRRISVVGSVALAYVFAITLPPIKGGTPSIPYTPAFILIAVVIFVGMLIRYGQGGTRLAGESSSILNDEPVGDRTADECWKLGFFYYNPSDPALVVEKRFGIGWTLNFGNRWSWLIIPVVLLPLVLPRL
jgi:uncharacterized membrane protein